MFGLDGGLDLDVGSYGEDDRERVVLPDLGDTARVVSAISGVISGK
ncbi:MAG TPA: hypothetical protein VGD11_02950 [Mycobacteriales bacterium]